MPRTVHRRAALAASQTCSRRPSGRRAQALPVAAAHLSRSATCCSALPPRAKHDARRAKPATKRDLDPRPPPALDLGDGRPVVVVADRARDSLPRAVAAVDDLYASETQPRADEPRKITPDKEKEGPQAADARRARGIWTRTWH